MTRFLIKKILTSSFLASMSLLVTISVPGVEISIRCREGATLKKFRQGENIVEVCTLDSKPETMIAHGSYLTRYPDLRPKSQQEFENGIPNGEWVEWYPSGKKMLDGRTKEGKRDGTWKYWYENGTLALQGEFEDRKPIAHWVRWHPNGKKWAEGDFEAGHPVGEWKTWNRDGKLIETLKITAGTSPDCKKGMKQVGARFPKSSLLRCERTLPDGRLFTESIEYHLNGRKSAQGSAIDYVTEGESTNWHDNGKLAFKAFYKDGKPHGKIVRWDRTGKKISESTYENGEVIKDSKR